MRYHLDEEFGEGESLPSRPAFSRSRFAFFLRGSFQTPAWAGRGGDDRHPPTRPPVCWAPSPRALHRSFEGHRVQMLGALERPIAIAFVLQMSAVCLCRFSLQFRPDATGWLSLPCCLLPNASTIGPPDCSKMPRLQENWQRLASELTPGKRLSSCASRAGFGHCVGRFPIHEIDCDASFFKQYKSRIRDLC